MSLQADTISVMKREKRDVVVRLLQNMVLSSGENIISGSGTNIKMEAAKEYDLTTDWNAQRYEPRNRGTADVVSGEW